MIPWQSLEFTWILMDEAPGVFLFTTISAAAYHFFKWKRIQQLSKEMVEYDGNCHCGTVRFKVKAPKHLVVWDCNCSICYMKKNWHFIVPGSCFENFAGEDALTEYRFNTKTAKHMFCKHCGVQAYYVPRSNPDGIAVTLACIKPEQVR